MELDTRSIAQVGPPVQHAPAAQLDVGEPGTSAQREYDRRHAKREAAIEQKWGRFAGVVKFLSDDPQSTQAWAKGSEGERRLAERLARTVGDRAVVLHDRTIPGRRGNIDHVAIAPSGVWVIDTKRYTGRVEHRDVGGWFRTDLRLYVGGRDRTKLVGGLGWQVDAVRTVLGDDQVPLHAALCFVDADWGLFPKPFRHDDVWIGYPRALSEELAASGQFAPTAVLELAHRLAAALPAAAPSS
jgi:hypothetical protein